MGRVLTNNTVLQYAIEDTENNPANIGQLPVSPTWFLLEPNSFGTIGSTITTVARDPISNDRQRRKGTITDLDSTAEAEFDLTFSHFTDFAEGFVFSRFQGVEEYNVASCDVDSFTVASGSTLVQNTLIATKGFLNSANNGLHVVGAGSTATDIVVGTTLIAETAPTNATLHVVGFRSAAGDLDVTVTSGVITITSAANIFTSVGLNLQAGMGIYFGGSDALNRFSDAANRGKARIVSVAANGSQIVIDNTDQIWVTESNTIQQVEFRTGQYLRNVRTTDANFLERSFQFEITYQNLGNPSGDEYEYPRGNYCNTLAFNLPLTDKATLSAAFVGTDTDVPTSTRRTNADSPVSPVNTTAVNTTQDFARLRITNVDETGLTTDFKSLTVTLNNNVSPEKVLANLGARFINFGNFEIDIETQLLFTDSAVVAAIRNNTTVRMDFLLQNDDGALYVDIPSMTLSGGGRDFPVNETVLINLTGQSFGDPTLGSSIGFTYYPIPNPSFT